MKDEINFHSFLNVMRQITGVTLEQVCDGLCSVSMMKRIESGERLPEKLMRDRILARMGVSLEGYEDYLPTEEYEHWLMRQRIVKNIEKRELDEAWRCLEKYREHGEQNVVAKQFCEAMKLMLLQLQDVSPARRAEVAERAVRLTMPRIDNGLSEYMLLSEQEINLLIEFVWLCEYPGGPEQEFEWRCRQYKDILHYIEQSHLDIHCRAMIYPKVVYYLCEIILEKARTEENIKFGIHICNQAIEVLRNSAKLYYFVELVEVFERLANEQFEVLRKSARIEEMKQIQASLAEKLSWREVMMGLYTEHEVNPYMTDFCYMYWEEESYCIGDVIRIRREMFGMTKAQLCEGICSEKTLTRIEHKRAKTQMPIVRALFERLGLCAEYIRARVISSDYEVLQLAEKCAQYENNYKIIDWESCLDELEQKLCLDIPQNKQVVMHSRYFLRLHKKELTKEEWKRRIIGVIEYTIPLECAMKPGEKFLTREEYTYIRNVGVVSEPEKDNPYMLLVKEICEQEEKDDKETRYIGKYEFLVSGLIGYLGDVGKYDESNTMSTRLVKKSLVLRRSGNLARALYNNLWNEYKRLGRKITRNEFCEKTLKSCISLSTFNKREYQMRFFEHILESCDEM